MDSLDVFIEISKVKVAGINISISFYNNQINVQLLINVMECVNVQNDTVLKQFLFSPIFFGRISIDIAKEAIGILLLMIYDMQDTFLIHGHLEKKVRLLNERVHTRSLRNRQSLFASALSLAV